MDRRFQTNLVDQPVFAKEFNHIVAQHPLRMKHVVAKSNATKVIVLKHIGFRWTLIATTESL